jgi:hypothetical protein
MSRGVDDAALDASAREVLIVLVSLVSEDELEALEQTLDDENRAGALVALRQARRELAARIEGFSGE